MPPLRSYCLASRVCPCFGHRNFSVSDEANRAPRGRRKPANVFDVIAERAGNCNAADRSHFAQGVEQPYILGLLECIYEDLLIVRRRELIDNKRKVSELSGLKPVPVMTPWMISGLERSWEEAAIETRRPTPNKAPTMIFLILGSTILISPILPLRLRLLSFEPAECQAHGYRNCNRMALSVLTVPLTAPKATISVNSCQLRTGLGGPGWSRSYPRRESRDSLGAHSIGTEFR